MRIGSVPYMNGKPLIWGLEHDRRVELTCEVPSKLAAMLRKHEIAAGLVSVAACFSNPELQIVRGITISCDGPVESIKLFHTGDIGSIRTVALDTSSLTSVLLAKVILKEKYGLSPDFISMPPSLSSMLAKCDAAVIIGDPAMQVPVDTTPWKDLGEEWHSLTGLPFVFAAWAVNPELARPEIIDLLHESKSVGLGSLEEISAVESRRLALPIEVCSHYLNDIMHYDMTPRHMEALQLFHEKALDYGYIAGGSLPAIYQG